MQQECSVGEATNSLYFGAKSDFLPLILPYVSCEFLFLDSVSGNFYLTNYDGRINATLFVLNFISYFNFIGELKYFNFDQIIQ